MNTTDSRLFRQARTLPRPVLALAALATAGSSSAWALTQNFFVTNTNDSGDGSLRQAILDTNATSPSVNAQIFIQTAGTLTLADPLPAIANTHTLSVIGQTTAGGAPTFNIDANGNRAFFIYATDTATQTAIGSVSISNLTVANASATGGSGGVGGGGGGGGAGLGGAVFLGRGALTLSNVAFSNNHATGGNGASGVGGFVVGSDVEYTSPGGGGGLGGTGGFGAFAGLASLVNVGTAGGGGGGVQGRFPDQTAAGGVADIAGLGTGNGAAGALTGFPRAGNGDISSGGLAGGGGGAGTNSVVGAGGGGVSGHSGTFFFGGAGGFGGGGGGGQKGGAGGFAGGGGGGSPQFGSALGGAGGFGGGGGGANTAGTAGFGAGAGGASLAGAAGGGGLGAGGAIFVTPGSTLTLQDVTFANDTVAGGTGGNGSTGGASNGSAGTGVGQAVLFGNSVSLSVSATKTLAIAETLGGGSDVNAAGGLTKTGLGTLILSSTQNSYTGGTTVNAGTLRANNFDPILGPFGSATGTGLVTVNPGGVLGGNGQFISPVSLAGSGATLDPGSSDGSRDLLYFNAGLSAASGAVFHFDVGTSSFENDVDLIVGGNLTLTGTQVLDISSAGPLAFGTTFGLIDFQLADASNLDPAQFTFAPGSVTGNLSLDQNILYLTIVPEPASLALLSLPAIGLLRHRRRRGQRFGGAS